MWETVHKNKDYYYAVGGFVLLLASILLYLWIGYHIGIVSLWVSSIICIGIFFRTKEIKKKTIAQKFTLQDYITIVLLTIIISTTYLSVNLTSYPLQMVGDEVNTTVKSLVLSQTNVDLFAPSDYYNFPAPLFALTGHIAKLFDITDILGIRLIHTIFTIATCVFGFLFFRRIFSNTFKAALSTALLAGSHSLFVIGNMAMLTNSAVLVCLISLIFLLAGLQKNSKLHAFVGGIVAGLGWYVYGPAKIIIFMWLASLLIIFILNKLQICKKYNLKHITVATLIGFTMAVCPFIIGAATTPQEGDTTWYYHQEQILLFPEGRMNQQRVAGTETWQTGMVKNAIDALTAFNRNIQDKGYIYSHYGQHGFVDPFTGILLWIGVISVLFTIRRQNIGMLLILILFSFLLGIFMFVVNRSPNYTRFIIMLPLITPLAVIGISKLTEKISPILAPRLKLQKQVIEKTVMVSVVMVIIFLNINIVSDYIDAGKENNEPISNTVRYIHAQAKQKPKYVHLFDKQKHYKSIWEPKDWQKVWINLFIPFNSVPENLSLKQYTTFRHGRKWILFGNHRESISNTIYYIDRTISKTPRYFYFIKEKDWLEYPQEFTNTYDWETWINLFTVFKQSFEIISIDHFITGHYSMPATFFVTEETWNKIHNQRLTGNVKKVQYLSSIKNLLIVEIAPTH